METVSLRSVENQSVLGAALPVTAETIDVLLELLTEAERKLAGVVAALRDDGRQAA